MRILLLEPRDSGDLAIVIQSEFGITGSITTAVIYSSYEDYTAKVNGVDVSANLPVPVGFVNVLLSATELGVDSYRGLYIMEVTDLDTDTSEEVLEAAVFGDLSYLAAGVAEKYCQSICESTSDGCTTTTSPTDLLIRMDILKDMINAQLIQTSFQLFNCDFNTTEFNVGQTSYEGNPIDDYLTGLF